MELYHLKTDVAETTDVSAQHPEVLEKIKGSLPTVRSPERKYPTEPRSGINDYVR